MSSNLDHVLYNKLNCTDDEKEENAYSFAKHYKNRLEDFISFMTASDFAVMTDYNASWEYIKEDHHSLERNSNLGLYLKTIEKVESAS